MDTTPILLDKSTDSILLLSDLEPDDLLAFSLLFNYIKKSNRKYNMLIIVGEGDRDKTELCKSIIASYSSQTQNVTINILQGPYSNKEFPEEIIRAYIKQDASKLENKKVDLDHLVASIETFLQQNNHPAILCLKPFQELLLVKQKELFLKANAYFYGGFNFRITLTRLKENKQPKNILEDFINNSFKNCYVYESFHATKQNNSSDAVNSPQLWNIIKKDDKLLTVIHEWNNFIVQDCLETSIKVSKEMSEKFKVKNIDKAGWTGLSQKYDKLVNRNLKIVNNVINAESNQLVMADFCMLTMILADNKWTEGILHSCDINFDDNFYTSLTDNKKKKVWMVTDINFKEMTEKVAKLLEE